MAGLYPNGPFYISFQVSLFITENKVVRGFEIQGKLLALAVSCPQGVVGLSLEHNGLDMSSFAPGGQLSLPGARVGCACRT